jgi:hypothetical protein
LKRESIEECRRKVTEKYGARFDVLGEVDPSARHCRGYKYIRIRCNVCGNIKEQEAAKFLYRGSCRWCRGRKGEQYYLDAIRARHGGDFTVLDHFATIDDMVSVRHNKCGNISKTRIYSILANGPCRVCAGKYKRSLFAKTPSKYVDEVKQLTNGEYEVLGEYINAFTPLKLRHNCGYEWVAIPRAILMGRGCPICAGSSSENAAYLYLKKAGIRFKKEAKMDGCCDKIALRFDYMIHHSDRMILLELDGEQHFGGTSTGFFGSYSEAHRRDEIKDKYCADRNIKLLRIPYWRFKDIPTILDEFILGGRVYDDPSCVCRVQ